MKIVDFSQFNTKKPNNQFFKVPYPQNPFVVDNYNILLINLPKNFGSIFVSPDKIWSYKGYNRNQNYYFRFCWSVVVTFLWKLRHNNICSIYKNFPNCNGTVVKRYEDWVSHLAYIYLDRSIDIDTKHFLKYYNIFGVCIRYIFFNRFILITTMRVVV